MLTEKQIVELKEHLEKAQNPLFFYDNDCDGLCSFLLFRRFLGRGKGVAVRSYPDLNAQYAKKAEELNADYVFVLDKPVVSREFVETLAKMHLPFVWIDHHNVSEEDFSKEFENVHIFNPAKNNGKDNSDEPVTFIAYKTTGRKEDMWIALMGCVADHFMPPFASEFGEKYPEFWGKGIKEPFDVYYKTEIGRIAKSLNFGLKDSITHVVQLQNYLINCQNPGEVLSEEKGNTNFRVKYKEIKKKYDSLLEKAKEDVHGKTLFFDYGGDLSISADLANELCYVYPEKYVAVAYRNGGICNISMRGKNVKKILNEVLRNFEGASGGGHEDAVGARIKINDLERFKEVFVEKTGKNE